MANAKKTTGTAPLPQYIMPDASEPEYEQILEMLQDYHNSLIGSSYYYIRVDDERCALCRIVPGAGKIFFHELVDHQKHGISDEDLEQSVQQDIGVFSLPGYYPVSSLIEQKLRILYEV
jgi:hypothetical protein